MSSYIVPAEIAVVGGASRYLTLEDIESMIADRNNAAVIPICGDCLEGAGVPDGGWVAVDFTRYPAPPRPKAQGGTRGDLCLCYAVPPGGCGPVVMSKEYVGKWGSTHLVGTKYKSMWNGDKLRMNWAVPAQRIFGAIFAAWDSAGKLLWTRSPEEFPEALGGVPTIGGDIELTKSTGAC